MAIKKIGVLGAGAMGTGIANVAIMSGYEVIIRDIDMSFIDRSIKNMDAFMSKSVAKGKMTEDDKKAALGRIKGTLALEDFADVDYVIEVVIENLDLKKEVFQALDKICRPDVILSSNTSSMSITQLGGMTGRPDKVCGMHFFNPAQVMRLVELTQGLKTSDETIAVARELSKSFGKTPILVKKDYPGFVVNRVMLAGFLEACKLLGEGVASVEDIDTAVKLGLNYPMGPFELMDYTGIDISYFVMNYIAEETKDGNWAAPWAIKQMVRAGTLGAKTGGVGFYDRSKK